MKAIKLESPPEAAALANGRSDWRGRQSEADIQVRNQRLLEVAADLFMENGLESTSIDSIAQAAGMTKRTIYQRFGDKTALFNAAIDVVLKEWTVPVEDLQALRDDTPRETLHRMAELLVSRMMDIRGRRMMRLTNMLSHEMPGLAERNMTEGTKDIIDFLVGLFAEWSPESRLPPRDRTDMAFSFMQLLLGEPARATAWDLELSPEEQREHARFCVDLFVDGFEGLTCQLADR